MRPDSVSGPTGGEARPLLPPIVVSGRDFEAGEIGQQQQDVMRVVVNNGNSDAIVGGRRQERRKRYARYYYYYCTTVVPSGIGRYLVCRTLMLLLLYRHIHSHVWNLVIIRFWWWVRPSVLESGRVR